jgi:hypothetical protein
MDRIELPLIPGSKSLGDAFDRMADSGAHAAIVMRAGGEPFLVRNTDLDAAFDQGIERIGQVQGTPLHAAQAELEGWEGALDDAGASYGIVLPEATADSGDDDFGDDDFGDDDFGEEAIGYGPPPARGPRMPATVTLVTRHERLAAEIRNSGSVCRCTGLHRHKGHKGAACRFCGSPVRCA